MSEVQLIFAAELTLRLVMIVVIVHRQRKSSSALAWIAVIAFLPVLGVVAYFFVGENRVGRRHAARYREAHALGIPPGLGPTLVERLETHELPVAELAVAITGIPATSTPDVLFFGELDDFHQALLADVDRAQDTCHLVYYILSDDTYGRALMEVLKRAALRDVSCRVLVDAVGSGGFLRSQTCRDARAGGVAIAPIMPVGPLRALVARSDLRNHRKLAAIDREVAYIGSHNMCDRWYPRKRRFGAWTDVTVQVGGGAARAVDDLFRRDWFANLGAELAVVSPPEAAQDSGLDPIPVCLVPSGPTETTSPFGDVLQQALRGARQRVTLTTPYFVPDDSLLSGMRTACLRGVQVRLVVPRRSDHALTQAAGRSYYSLLLEAGAEIFEFEPGIVHAKTVTVDGRIAVVGSSNLDIRSFLLNFESSLVIFSDGAAAALESIQAGFLSESRQIDPRSWQGRSPVLGFGDNLARLLAPLL